MAAIRALPNGPNSVANDDPFAGASHAADAVHRRGVKPIAVYDLKSPRSVRPQKGEGMSWNQLKNGRRE